VAEWIGPSLYRCDGCGQTNTAINDLEGMRHKLTNRKPPPCDGEGRFRLVGRCRPGGELIEPARARHVPTRQPRLRSHRR
jgi:hypothetical protein